MEVSEGAQRLLAQMLNKSFYVVIRIPADLSKFQGLLEAHLQWAISAEKRGELFASGPFVSEQAGVPGSSGGMSIIRASTPEAAHQILSEDPFIKNGVYIPEIKKWLLMEGGMTVTMRFSDQAHILR